MYHLDPNLNVALERQADRVRAVHAVGQRQGRLGAEMEQPGAADLPSRERLQHRPYRWLALGVVLLVLLLALTAWSGGAIGALWAWA